ncbi:anti-sigma factor family protein [Streptomyces sp. NBC_01022]|uniref:anti-sigma factor family protein n=1 Tax=Streptomyces sp. NBC_01022 TaxID=2903723 RepID=UPI002DDAC58A|nr:zf-HC2 domain-containing protein [Streptomyces sp. NBC_01022]WRZ84246.1 zf-HC2 domain-containing protein [Streptomyces sp. NBC_01022]
MSGTGPTSAEQHLGDRLAALVDGELKHDARDRVLAHLATCTKCKAEAAAQRRLKSVFAQSAPPSPSEGFLARLQGLPGGPGGDDDGRGRPSGDSGRFGDGVFPAMQPSGRRGQGSSAGSPPATFGYLPTLHGSTAVLPAGPAGSVFRIHEVGREGERSPWRGRRFAFAAASAVSLAAIALGGALPTDSGIETPVRAEGPGNTVAPLDADARAASGTVSRRGGGSHGTLAAAGADRPFSLAVNAAPLAFSSAPPLLGTGGLNGSPFALPVQSAVSAPSLIRPDASNPLFARALGSGLTPAEPVAPSAEPSRTPTSAAGAPAPADHGLPLSPRR